MNPICDPELHPSQAGIEFACQLVEDAVRLRAMRDRCDRIGNVLLALGLAISCVDLLVDPAELARSRVRIVIAAGIAICLCLGLLAFALWLALHGRFRRGVNRLMDQLDVSVIGSLPGTVLEQIVCAINWTPDFSRRTLFASKALPVLASLRNLSRKPLLPATGRSLGIILRYSVNKKGDWPPDTLVRAVLELAKARRASRTLRQLERVAQRHSDSDIRDRAQRCVEALRVG